MIRPIHSTRRSVLAGAAAASLGFTAPAVAKRSGDVSARQLSNPRASARARLVYGYLWSVYGTRTLTGQQESSWTPAGPGAELDYIQRVSGKLPAILGLDYIHPEDQLAVNDRATRWYRDGGIPTICWHWGAPDIGTGYENAKKDFDVAAALRPGTPQNRLMMKDLEHVADLLGALRDRDVPVLWRPFHEFSGDWFWWGKHGPGAFKALWTLMYDHFTRDRGLDNLIWVLGWAGQNVDPAYYPGRDRVDLAGADLYVHDHGDQAGMFGQVKAIVGEAVPICMHECGPIPDPTVLGPDSAWLYFLTWHTNFIMDGQTNTSEEIRRFYRSDRYLTRDELPPLTGA